MSSLKVSYEFLSMITFCQGIKVKEKVCLGSSMENEIQMTLRAHISNSHIYNNTQMQWGVEI